MGLTGASVGSRGTVALQHRPGLPAGQPHQIRLAAALGEPLMGECVAELMRVQAGKAHLLTPAPQHHDQAPLGEPAFLAEPQPREIAVLVAERTRR